MGSFEKKENEMVYPILKQTDINDQVLMKNFTINNEELEFIQSVRSDSNRLGLAVFYKTYIYIGYPCKNKEEIPLSIINWIATQLNINADKFNKYEWKKRSWKRHLTFIRHFTGYRAFQIGDHNLVSKWFADQIKIYPTRNTITELLINKLKELKIELPSLKEFKRLINSSRRQFFHNLYNNIQLLLSQDTKNKINETLATSLLEGSYNWLKTPPGKLGMKTILEEIKKLEYIQQMKINRDYIDNLHQRLVKRLYNRCRAYDAGHLKTLKNGTKFTLMSVFFYMREMEVSDNIVHIFLELIRKIEKKANRAIELNVVGELRKVYGKRKILRELTFAVTENPSGTIENTIFPVVDLDTFNRLAEEYSSLPDEDYDTYKIKIMRKKYANNYRRMIKPILDVLVFNTNNIAYKEILRGLDIIHTYINKKYKYFPMDEDVPINLLTGKYADLAIERTENGDKVIKHYFELSVLEKVEKTVKCKEIWIQNAGKFRNPDADLPTDWSSKRIEYYKKIDTPIDGAAFVKYIQDMMKKYLSIANDFFSKKREDDVYIYQVGASEKGLWRVPKIRKKKERVIIQEIKEKVVSRWGILDLIDILVEADRQIDFSRFFTSSGQRQILTKDQIRERLLINLFSLGTINELKRTYKAGNPNCSYDDLLYFRNHYIFADALREAIVALTNKIFKIRDTRIWGNTTACASDGKQFGAYEQNLIADSNPHYRNKGIMVYWHVDRNSTCIYSQLKSPNSSEIWPMIEGLTKHETEMKIDTNFVDSRGQSEVAFGVCHFFKIDLIPRLKRIKYERLYLPDKDMISLYPNLKTVLSRPIRWNIIREQYDEMVKHITAIKEGTGSTEAILRRFTSYNNTHPTYKAFIELGKAKKTIFLCKYLTIPPMRGEAHSALNIIENWNSVNSFIGYGSKSEFNTNDPAIQELMVLSLHLLQNAVILVNTIMIDKIINEFNYLPRLSPKDLQALTPLFTSNINPYGNFILNLSKPSFLGGS